MLQTVLDYRLEIAAFLAVVAASAVALDRLLLQTSISRRWRAGIGGATALLALGGALLAESVGEAQRAQEQVAIEGLAPTYAAELALRGHHKIGLHTPPDDPVYGELIERQIAWDRLNDNVQDVYTMRLDADGRARLIVDSETDYDRNNVFHGRREMRTPIGEVYPLVTPAMAAAFRGELAYEGRPVSDRWGTWVSAYAPIHAPDGRLDGLVGVDFDAYQWLEEILWSRCAALCYTSLLLTIWLGGISIIALLRADIAAMKIVEGELARAARLDRLTGLPNRLLVLDRLQHLVQRARDSGTKFALMFLDFDRFKLINDSLGHDMGDALLIEISRRLRSQLQFADSISSEVNGPSAGRLGGDEFVVVLERIDSLDDAKTVADRLLQVFADSYQLGCHEVVSTASIGMVIGDESYLRAEDALRDADTAMFEAKRAGKARYVLFDASMREARQRRLWIENELRRALAAEQEQLSLVYQPIVSLQTGELTGVEALARWRHPEAGEISPREFVPVAEEAGLILELGAWVIEESCRQLRDWTARLDGAGPQFAAVNLSRKQFLQPDLPVRLRQLLEQAGLAPGRLQLEVAESALGRDLPAALATLRLLKQTGVRLAIDHFGNECSSFASLHEFPVDVVKIDYHLIQNIEQSQATAALIHSLAVLARNLNLAMMAEGVERPTQVVALQELGCRYGQGYYLGRPQTAEQIEELIAERLALPYCVEGTKEFSDRWSQRLPALQSRTFDDHGALV